MTSNQFLAALAALAAGTCLVAQDKEALTVGPLRAGSFTRWSVAAPAGSPVALFVGPAATAYDVEIPGLGVWSLGDNFMFLGAGLADSSGFFALDLSAPADLKAGTSLMAQGGYVGNGMLVLTNAGTASVGDQTLQLGSGGVDATVPGDFASIQAAIRNAADLDSSGTVVIRVLPGTYLENIDVRRSNIELRGDASNRPEIRGGGHDDTIEVTAVSGFRISGFLVTNDNGGLPSVEEGLHIRSSTGCIVTDNEFRGCEEGLKIETTTGATVTNNRMIDNSHNGADVRDSSDVTLAQNTATGNGDHGLRIRESGSGNTVRDNTCTGNDDDGLRVEDTASVSVTGNNLSNNTESGLRVRDVAGGTVTGNTMTGNTEFGIRVRDSAVDFGGGNTPPGDNTVGGNGRGNVRVD